MKLTLKLLYLIISLLILLSCQNYHSKKGLKSFYEEDYTSALFHFHKAGDIENYFENEWMMAEAYFKLDELDSSEHYYSKSLIKNAKFSKSYLPYAKVLFSNGKYDEAERLLKNKNSDLQTNIEAEMLLNICNSIHHRDSNQILSQRRKKESEVNAFGLREYRNADAFLPENKVYNGNYADAWTKTSYENLLQNEKRTTVGDWITPELINQDKYNRFYDGPPSFSKDGLTVYFTRSDYSKNDSIEKRMKIFSASSYEGRWTDLKEFEWNSDFYSVGHATLTSDGDVIYFASDMPGGHGGIDLYSCRKENGRWSKPENLGSVINSSRNEFFPYIDSNGALFYSSDQSNELGKLDVFITYFNGKHWLKPESINSQLNATSHDFGFSFDARNIDNILKITPVETTKPKFILRGRALNKLTQTPVQGAVIEITTGKTGELIQLRSDANGFFDLDLEKGIDYMVFLKNKNSLTQSTSFTTKNVSQSLEFYVNYQVETIELNQPVTIGHIEYAKENWEISLALKNELDKLIHALRFNPSVMVEIAAYTDISGDANYNKILSDKRSLAAVAYLISQGIHASRLSFKGYGEENIMNKCSSEEMLCSEKEHGENRRIAYKILSY